MKEGAGETKKDIVVSVSQIERFMLCERKWWLAKVLKHYEPPSPAMQDGIDFAQRMESYLLGKLPYDELTAHDRAGVQYLPKPGTKIAVEQKIWIDLSPEAGLIGFADYIDYNFLETHGVIIVGDHKRRGNVDKWSKTEEQLLDDWQMLMYAEAVFRAHGDKVRVIARHVNYQRAPAPPASVMRQVEITRENAARKTREALKVVDKMREVRKVTHITSLPVGDCTAYGGCKLRKLGPCPEMLKRLTRGRYRE